MNYEFIFTKGMNWEVFWTLHHIEAGPHIAYKHEPYDAQRVDDIYVGLADLADSTPYIICRGK